MGNRKLIIGTVVLAIIVIAFIFLAPIVPATFPSGASNPNIYSIYHHSLSSLFSPVGTSYWNGHYFFQPHINPYKYDV